MKSMLALLPVLAVVLSCGSSQKEDVASVCLLGFKTEADPALRKLAALDTEQTGAEDKTVTASCGN